jgi:hypothetical protein
MVGASPRPRWATSARDGGGGSGIGQELLHLVAERRTCDSVAPDCLLYAFERLPASEPGARGQDDCRGRGVGDEAAVARRGRRRSRAALERRRHAHEHRCPDEGTYQQMPSTSGRSARRRPSRSSATSSERCSDCSPSPAPTPSFRDFLQRLRTLPEFAKGALCALDAQTGTGRAKDGEEVRGRRVVAAEAGVLEEPSRPFRRWRD